MLEIWNFEWVDLLKIHRQQIFKLGYCTFGIFRVFSISLHPREAKTQDSILELIALSTLWIMQIKDIEMEKLKISFLEKSDISEASRVLSEAMLKNPVHIAVFQGHGEKERKIIEKMFFELLSDLPSITFLARMNRQIVGVMRMKTCNGSKVSNEHAQTGNVTNLDWRAH